MTEPAEPHPSKTYRYVEVADGGIDHRGRVKWIEQVDGFRKTEQYHTYGRATVALKKWLDSHTNKDGRNTTAQFDGAIWTPFQHLDFDAEDDVEKALGWARLTQQRLIAMGVDLNAPRWFYSGYKGFHCEIPSELFGGFTPGTELHRQLKAAAALILLEIPFDPTVYNKLRLWRIENSINSKGKRFKIRLTPEELMTLNMGEILGLALGPRRYPRADSDTADWLAVPDLVDIWREAGEQASKPATSGPSAAVGDDERDRITSAAIGASWPRFDEQGARPVRHDFLLAIGGFLARHTSAEHAARLMKAGAEASGDHDREWSDEIERIAAGSAEKIARGALVVGLPRLAEQFPGLAKVLGVLWEEPFIELEIEGPAATAQPPRLAPASKPMNRIRQQAAIRAAFSLTTTITASVLYTPPKIESGPVIPDLEPVQVVREPSQAESPLPRACPDCGADPGPYSRRCPPCHQRHIAAPDPTVEVLPI